MKKKMMKFCSVILLVTVLYCPVALSIPPSAEGFCNIVCMLRKFGFVRMDKIFDILDLLLESFVVKEFLPEIIYKALSTGDVLSVISRLPWEDFDEGIGKAIEEIASEIRKGLSEVQPNNFAAAKGSVENPVENIPKAVHQDLNSSVLASSPELEPFPTSFLPGASMLSLNYLVSLDDAGSRGGASTGYPVIQENIRKLADEMVRNDIIAQVSKLMTEVELLKESVITISKKMGPTGDDGETAGFDDNIKETWNAIASNYGMLNDLAFKRELLLEKLNVLFMLDTQIEGHIAAMEAAVYASELKYEMMSTINRLHLTTLRHRGF